MAAIFEISKEGLLLCLLLHFSSSGTDPDIPALPESIRCPEISVFFFTFGVVNSVYLDSQVCPYVLGV